MERQLEGWPELTPDPAAMERVSALMISGMATAQAQSPEPGESFFRVACAIWAVVAVCGYLAWDLFTEWLGLHPLWTVVLIGVGLLSVAAPLLLILVPVLRKHRPVVREGGTALC